MRRDSLVKLVAVLACIALLAMNTAFAQTQQYSEGEEVGTETVSDMQAQEEEAADADAAELQSSDEEEGVAEIFVDDQGTDIELGTMFTYNDVLYKVNEENNPNIINNGNFESDSYLSSTDTGTETWIYLSGSAARTPDSARSGEAGLSVSGGTTLIYRVYLDSAKTYVYSAWYKLPEASDCNFDDSYRHIVCGGGINIGYNEIGRSISKTGGWQQVLIVFTPTGDVRFSNYLRYNGSQDLFVDDVAIYEVTEIDEVVTVLSSPEPSYYDDTNEEFYPEEGYFEQRGSITHTTRLLNSGDSDESVIAIVAVFRNDQLAQLYSTGNTVIRAGVRRDLEITFEIPQDGDIEEYRYEVFFINNLTSMQIIGSPSALNPMVVVGRSV